MVGFGKRMADTQVPEWSTEYVPYKVMKKHLKRLVQRMTAEERQMTERGNLASSNGSNDGTRQQLLDGTADAGVRTGAGWIGVTADLELRPPLAIAEAAPTGVSAGRLPRAERAGDVLPRFGVPLRRLMAGAAPRNCCGAATRSCVCRSSLATVQPCPKRPRTLWQDKTLRVSQHGRGAGHDSAIL